MTISAQSLNTKERNKFNALREAIADDEKKRSYGQEAWKDRPRRACGCGRSRGS